jgi:hypothetical protein
VETADKTKRRCGMTRLTPNPYPETIMDEASREVVSDERHSIWQAGYMAGQMDRMAAVWRRESAKQEGKISREIKKEENVDGNRKGTIGQD